MRSCTENGSQHPPGRAGMSRSSGGFHRFLQVRKAVEIEASFGVRLVCPIDEFNASRHVGDDSPARLAPLTPERVAEFFDFMKSRIATARKYAPAARDYALFRALYHGGFAVRGGRAAGGPRRAFRARPVRQAACAVR